MPAETPILGVRALFFDVFGTLMDWRTSVAREAEKILEPLGHRLDWIAFADAWRGEYQPGHGGGTHLAGSPSPSSTCCTGATSCASCRASICRTCPTRCSTI